MTGSVAYFENTWTVSPSDELAIPIHGEFVYVIRCSDATFGIGFDGDETGLARQGSSFRMPAARNYQSVRVKNLRSSFLTITLGYGRGEFELNQLSVLGGRSLDTIADATIAATNVQELFAANINRRLAIIEADSGNATFIRVGGILTGPAGGHKLIPGARLELPTTDRIRVYNPHGASQKVIATEIVE